MSPLFIKHFFGPMISPGSARASSLPPVGDHVRDVYWGPPVEKTLLNEEGYKSPVLQRTDRLWKPDKLNR